MKKVIGKIKQLPWLPIGLITITIIFFSIRLVITYDSAHYLNYVAIFENTLPPSSWDIVRGPIFPILIFLFNVLFGKTSAGILIGTFIFYLIFSITCYTICKELCKEYKHKKLIQNILIAILILNPLIMGYFHVLLTEFVAITIAMLNILLAYKWINCGIHNKRKSILYTVYFVLSTIFLYHLKQPYVIIAFIPLLTAIVISIIKKHTAKNILYRLGTLTLSIVFLIVSILTWNNILSKMQVDMETGRDTSSLLSSELLKAYQITYDADNDGKNDPVTTAEAINILSDNFVSNPPHILKTYINNYCGLTSICEISTKNTIDYTSSSTFAGIETYENTAIGYRPYSNASNIFDMPKNLHEKAAAYGESSDRSFFALVMNVFEIPTNLLLKISYAICLPSLIFLIFIKIKFNNSKYNSIFTLTLILLITSFSHLAISASIGLIIDRYAIEVFVPSMLGIFGTVTYTKLAFSRTPNKTKPKNKKSHISTL